MIWLSNIYDVEALKHLGTLMLSAFGFVGFGTFVVWYFGGRND